MLASLGGWRENVWLRDQILDLTEATRQLQHDTGITAQPDAATAVSGGSVCQAYRVPSSHGPLFVKLRSALDCHQFEAEADGLQTIDTCGALKVPTIYCYGSTETTAYLFLEWLELGARSTTAEIVLGHSLARQHTTTAASFGWSCDNFIGASAQPNHREDDWIAFWRDSRLGFQLDLAAENGLPATDQEAGAALLDRLENFFGDEEIVPSLLHGDLWSGNWGVLAADVPCIFDPAVYCGDREADLAMTRLFGGFGPAFYDAYMTTWPLRPGWERRVDLYNLYHLLNHFNIFGTGYLPQVSGSLVRLVDRG